MLESEYYEKYRGPNLIKCTYDNKDITDDIKKYYGELNNWNGKLYTYKDIGAIVKVKNLN